MSSQIEAINLRPFKAGGRGDLFIGQLRGKGTLVIVKFLREAHLPHERQAFLREIRILSMNMGGMVRLLGSGMLGRRPFYIMEYVLGGSLTQYAGMLAEPQLRTVAFRLAEILSTFHGQAGGHGDIKPDNILLSHDGQLKVGDPLGNGPIGPNFSVLFAPDRGGTAGYWAPEVRNGGKVSAAADSFSYAATLFHLVTGRRPVDGQQLDPAVHGFACPNWLRQLITLCSQMDPRLRPTMGEILRALRGESWETIYGQRQTDRVLTLLVVAGLALVGFGFFLQRSK